MIFTPYYFLRKLTDYLDPLYKDFIGCTMYRRFGYKHNNLLNNGGKDLISAYNVELINLKSLADAGETATLDWIRSLDFYITFIIGSTADFLFQNNEFKLIYAEDLHNELDTRNLFFNFKDYKLKFSIKDNNVSLANTSPLLEYLNDETSSSKIVVLEGKREIGSEPIFSYQYLVDDKSVKLMGDSEDRTTDTIKRDTINAMEIVFNSTINNIFSKYVGKTIVDWQVFLKNGIWVPRHTDTK